MIWEKQEILDSKFIIAPGKLSEKSKEWRDNSAELD